MKRFIKRIQMRHTLRAPWQNGWALIMVADSGRVMLTHASLNYNLVRQELKNRTDTYINSLSMYFPILDGNGDFVYKPQNEIFHRLKPRLTP